MQFHFVLLVLCFPLTLANEAALQEFTSGNNLFTASIYKEIRKTEPGNFLVSPFSAESILALAQSGAKEATAQEIRTGLHLPNSQEKIEAAVKTLKPVLRKKLYTLNQANKIYVKKDFVVREGFKKIATDVFGCEVDTVDFNKREVAAATMNQWVEERTEHKIQNLIRRDHLNDRTRMILINALYFKGNWSSPFEKFLTAKEDFYIGKAKGQVDMMHDTVSQKYYESKELNAKFLELPFEGEEVTLTIVLPNNIDGISTLETHLEEVLKTPKYTRENVQISLPKFKVESEVDFKEILQKLGVNKAFRPDEADLSGIAGNKGDLIIDKILQKTFVDVNEDGAEAAAATYAAVGVPLSGYFPPQLPKQFKADHPFIFYIKVKDLILFAGSVVDPSQK